LRQVHQAICTATPGAKESLRWSMPACSYHKILVTLAVFKHHVGFYPMPSAIRMFTKDLSKYKTATGSVQFPLDKKLPLSLIRKIAQIRLNRKP
jgi:uncharacterized protein YdhG (YjbR/CyaY superfamily)